MLKVMLCLQAGSLYNTLVVPCSSEKEHGVVPQENPLSKSTSPALLVVVATRCLYGQMEALTATPVRNPQE